MYLLTVFLENLAGECGSNANAERELKRDFRNLHTASNSDALEHDWHLWKALRLLRMSNSRAPLPKDYDELAEAVIAAANELPCHPGPVAHANKHIESLLTAGAEFIEPVLSRSDELRWWHDDINCHYDGYRNEQDPQKIT